MNHRIFQSSGIVGLILLVGSLTFTTHGASDDDWPSFRGRDASGVALGHATVTTWNIETGENVLWKTPIPGLAHSSPVIWGDRLFVTTAVKQGEEPELKVGLYGSVGSVEDDSVHQMKVYCLDKNSGEILWERTSIEAVPKVKRHPKGSHAASTPATDGQYVLAFFASEGLYCYDVEGNLKWSKDFGVLTSSWYVMEDAEWGFSSSPIIHEDKVIVQCDIMEDSFLTALDLATGRELWRTSRNEVPTWSTPTIDVREGRSQVICNGWKHIGGYDLETGAELWKISGGGDIPVPTPIVAHDLIYLTSAHGRMAPRIAIDVMAKGEIELTEEDPQIAWMYPNRGNYMQTPIVYGDLIYFCKDDGIVSCYDAKTGEEHFRNRLGSGQSGFTASPVAADGKLYYTSEYGEIHVIKIGKEFESLAVNTMDTECMATPAISEGKIYWRTRGEVIAIGVK
ncbi:MAG: PQQ-binding-like beta-propeller repeat protein [Planctomycetota bacterium]|nr:PQQ-binding-like beta-propeller repeat protein [Planctomycetota bacterium]